ncbi:SIS domain-containing protein [Neobacillus sp. OS1-33]|uniref:SIS domain-containing protein n=1 Tax=Neobacillus sp. OS1-33 TaxID=3070683 RepID=UPI0027DF8E2D|nr:SIS domain-containing protein [Neobacillus sp. OS1-33]WML27214.1 SIS domain-containing protein [Neobacillus sp. OS1-33]
MESYYQYVTANLEKLYTTQIEKMGEAATCIFEALQHGGRFLVTGSGHSHMFAEEFYVRAGGFAQVSPILPNEFFLHDHPLKSTVIERIEAYAKVIFDLYKITSKDVLVIASNSGRNGMTVELAKMVQECGTKVIAFTNPIHPAGSKSRHSSGKYLCDFSNVVIDSCTGPGDAAFYVEEANTGMGATSTMAGAFVAQTISILLAKKYHQAGLKPPVFKSSNVDGGEEWNKELFAKYYGV